MLTVLMATRNRARILDDVLESYCRLESPRSGWKLVVIDNGSTDHTPKVIACFEKRLPLHAASEPKLGKNHALNTGLPLLEGNLAVFTDDDAFPHRDWLVQLRRAADAQPEYSIFGGSVLPRWEVPPPAWVRWVTNPSFPHLQMSDLQAGPVYTLSDPSLKDGPVDPGLVFGPNMAIRSTAMPGRVRFDPSIGPRGSSYPMGSETEFVARLSREGHRCWYVQAAVVEHLVRREQLKKRWVLERAIRFGRGRHRLAPNPKLWLGLPRHVFRDIPKAAISAVAAGATFQHESFFRARWRFNYLLGAVIESRLMGREARARAEQAPALSGVLRRRS